MALELAFKECSTRQRSNCGTETKACNTRPYHRGRERDFNHLGIKQTPKEDQSFLGKYLLKFLGLLVTDSQAAVTAWIAQVASGY